MSTSYPDKPRQPMPRCIDYATAAAIGLLRTFRQHQANLEKPSFDVIVDWQNNPTIFTAVDLVSEAIIVKDFSSEHAVSAAHFILDKAPAISKFVREIALIFLGYATQVELAHDRPSPELYQRKISKLKEMVRSYPSNPIAWSELSLCYAVLGQTDKSRAAMQVALQIGGGNRFILRSAARCFAHLHEPDRSVWILNKSGFCEFDPWIASAEIAISESTGLRSKCLPKAKELLKNNDLSDFSKSELAAGIGTIEMKNGDVRRAKKLLRQAILDPTENALAQAQWVATELRMNIGTAVDVAQLENRVPASFEAQAIKSFYDCDFKKSLEASELWSRFQHMSSRPIVHASFVASTFLEDEPKAIEIMTTSMPAQQGDFTVTNNQAFSLVNLGEIKEGIRLLSTIDVQSLSKRERLVLSATSGFVSFRVGETDEARNLYNISIDGFNRLKDPMSAALATYFLAREEKRLQSEFAEARINEAKDRIKKLNLPPFNFLAKKL